MTAEVKSLIMTAEVKCSNMEASLTVQQDR